MALTKSSKYWYGLIIVVAIVGYNIYGYFDAKKDSKITVLVKESEKINKSCPLKIDQYTTLDSTDIIHEPLSLNYYYTVDVDKDTVKNLESIKNYIKKNNQGKLDNEKNNQWLRNENILMKHNYRDWKGDSLFNYIIKSTVK
jgi:D-alanyl-lipoteichoic acid acyltransferase DltB (MBOAT superfamily)